MEEIEETRGREGGARGSHKKADKIREEQKQSLIICSEGEVITNAKRAGKNPFSDAVHIIFLLLALPFSLNLKVYFEPCTNTIQSIKGGTIFLNLIHFYFQTLYTFAAGNSMAPALPGCILQDDLIGSGCDCTCLGTLS